jgi:hypothetical protein
MASTSVDDPVMASTSVDEILPYSKINQKTIAPKK